MDTLIILLVILNICLGVAVFVAFMARLDRAYEVKNRAAIQRAERILAERRANDAWYQERRGEDWNRNRRD